MEIINKKVEVEMNAKEFFKKIEKILDKTIEKGINSEYDKKLMKEVGFSESEMKDLNRSYMMLTKLFSLNFMFELRKYFQGIVDKEVK